MRKIWLASGLRDNEGYKQLKRGGGRLIDYQEEKALEAICVHHGADDPALMADVARLIKWVHQSEQALHGGEQPVFLICMEGMLGMHRPKQGQDQARAA